ncbi:MAG: imidazole glycerol phosphate synthase subunit HisH [Candidatus Peribacteraceae bacterium]|nr:imidazole glycerol phosphate synthase subunit HisH [Candidatus Peribacteraceae bacterium]
MKKIVIVDYGVGNIHSAMKGLKRFTEDVVLSEDPEVIRNASALVLPGQGAFKTGMDGIKVRGLLNIIREAGAAGKPILGICLGAQLLLAKGFEFGEHEGLGLLPGKVIHFPTLEPGTKIPHMGWNAINEPTSARWKGTALEGLRPGAEMYFIHSYILQPTDPAHVLATTVYGGLTFPSVIGTGNIIGCQFHPEKSGEEGLGILKKFVSSIGG